MRAVLVGRPVRLSVPYEKEVHRHNNLHTMDDVSRHALIEHLLKYAELPENRRPIHSPLRSAVSSWYLDARQTTFSGDGAWLVGRGCAGSLGPIGVEAVGGMTIGF